MIRTDKDNKLLEEFYNRDTSNESRAEYKKKLYELQKAIWGDIFSGSEKAKDAKKKRNEEYNKTHKRQIKETVKKWESVPENKEKINKSKRERYKARMQNDILFRVKENIRQAIKRAFKEKNHKKSSKTTNILGCTFDELKVYLENKFESWMSWDNYGSYRLNGPRTWQVDHIFSLCTAKTKEDIIKLNHYTNLRPLCSKINLEEGGRKI